jgi:competence protein ComGC
MPRARFCTQSGANVWVREDGSCANGHPASAVTDVYDAIADAEAAPPVAPVKQSHAIYWIVGAVVAVSVLLFLVGLLVAIAVPVFSSASTAAAQKSCFANQRTVEAGIQLYLAENAGAPAPADWRTAMSDLVPAIIKSEPKCPSGGTYSLVTAPDGTTVISCSVHGSATASSAP